MVEVILDLRGPRPPVGPAGTIAVRLTVIIPPFPKMEADIEMPEDVVKVLEEGGKLACGLLGLQDVSLKLIVSDECAISSTLEKE